MLQKLKFTSVDLLLTFYERSINIGIKLELVTEILIENAYKEA